MGQAPRRLRAFAFPRSAQSMLDGLCNPAPRNDAYDAVVRYFALAWLTYRNPASSAADFPGEPSWSGRDCDALEGFARIMPLFAAWCASGRPSTIAVKGRMLDIPGEFCRGLLAGTDPEGPDYWGAMPGRSNQRIVEAADIALALWLLRGPVWDTLDAAERAQVTAWFAQARGKSGLDNNWHLFFVLIDRVFDALGVEDLIDDPAERYQRVKQFHIGSGWFSDGPGGRVDYYNAWGFHYALTWIDRIDPAWDPGFIRSVRRAFLEEFRYFIGPHGFPAFGRSLCYRLAVPAPLVAGTGSDPDIVAPGAARRALDAVWSHYVGRGAIQSGAITQGLFGPDMRLLDPYSGPASGLWSLRSLVMAYWYAPGEPFWTASPTPLPVEQGDFERCLSAQGWRVQGLRETGEIILHIKANRTSEAPRFEELGRTDRWRCALGLKPRPTNLKAKYDAPFYSSTSPLAEP